MKYNTSIYCRKSIRLKGYNYSQAGLYFITICTQYRKNIFGKIVGAGSKPAQMKMNMYGDIVKNTWFDLVNHVYNIKLHEQEFVVMPNHVHGIIENINIDNNWAGLEHTPTIKWQPISEIIRQFKTFSARQINKACNMSANKLWQRNYYEHIIRNEESYLKITEYIRTNPENWSKDKYFVE